MTIEQRSAHSWRITQMVEGKRIRISVDHKPSKKEALELIAEAIKTGEGSDRGSFKAACDKYISIKSNVLSPRTVREYTLTVGRLPEWFLSLPVQSMTAADVQKVVNELAVNQSPKSVHNYHGFISAVLKLARPGLTLRTTLPKIQKQEPYIPKKDELLLILKEVRGTMFEVPIRLGCWGLRRGEICALELSDLTDDNIVHITKDMVMNVNKEWVIKPPKTTASFRNVPIDKGLADLIRKQGYVYKGHPGSITKHMELIQKKYNLEKFTLHKLRHHFCSLLLDMGYNIKTVQGLGGWAGPETVNRVYRHDMAEKNKAWQEKLVNDMWSFLEDSEAG